MRQCMKKVKLLLQAKIPCIWINTYEEEQVLNCLKQICVQLQGYNLHSWSLTSGIKKENLISNKQEECMRAPIDKVFSMINEHANSDNYNKNLWIFKDLHALINNDNIKRAIRDLKEKTNKNYNPIIVISPIVDIPMELVKLFEVVEYDLPDKVMIKQIVDCALKQIKLQKLKQPSEEDMKKIVNGLTGLTFNEIRQTIAKSLVKYKTLNPTIIHETKMQLIKKSGVLSYTEPKISMKDIGGNKAFKKWYSEMKELFSEEAIKFGCQPPKGCLNLGIPGCGKSVLAEAIANDLNVPFLKLEMSRILSKFVGASEQNIAQAFRIVDSCAPCVLLIDECEKALSGTKSSNASDSGTTARLFSQVLTYLSDQNNKGVFVVMTANDISQLPPELSRAGRLDSIWYFSLPCKEERKEIFKIHLTKAKKDFDEELLDQAVEKTKNFTGAEIEQVVKSTIRKAYIRYKKDDNPKIIEKDIMESIYETIPIYKSSKENILALEQWSKDRAKNSNNITSFEENNPEADNDLISALKWDF